MILPTQIREAKSRTIYTAHPHHEDEDCIRIAYEWLDAPKKLARSNSKMGRYALKHIIENWGGRYVSQTDVDVAATLHPEISGSYPRYNISIRLIRPSSERLKNIPAAYTQDYGERYQDVYVSEENIEIIT